MSRSILKVFVFVIALLLPLSLLLDTAPAGSKRGEAAGIDPDSYPMIGDEELGQLRWVLQIADQEFEDFTNLEALDQLGMTSYRYVTAFMSYFLAIEQYHKLPACQQIIRPRLDRLIRKMITKPVWEYWAGVSQGITYLEPGLNKPYPESHDPVVDQNIMYSGHLGHMIGLYEMLYRDFKWDEPGAIVFAWSDDEKYIYDNHSLQKVMYDQMNKKPNCIACEPNACFPECNQHPVLSFILYDQTHGTDLAEVNEKFLNFFLEKKMIHPNTHRTAALYLVKQDITLSQHDPRLGNALDLALIPAVSLGIVSIESSSADGWTAAFMHAWQKEYIERHYPYMRKRHLIELGDEDAYLKYDAFEPRLNYGFFAMLAAEMGDAETRDKLIARADEKYGPIWKDGAFYYPFDRDKKCTNMVGKLLAIARALPKDGLWTMHNRPFDDFHFMEPRLEGVNFPTVVLRRAIYDREKKALIVTFEPGTKKRGSTRFAIANLDPIKNYALFIDTEEKEQYTGSDRIELEAPLDGRHDLVLIEQ